MTKRQLTIFSFILFLIATAASAQVTFTDVAERAGIHKTVGIWATWGDYDNDGDADMLIARRLYRNEGDGTFLDVTESVGITGNGPNSAIFLDFDNDGNLDIFMSGNNNSVGDLLYRNLGDGTFSDVSQVAGMIPEARSQAGYILMDAVSFDYDNNGFLDIFVSNIMCSAPFPNFFYHNEGNGHFREIAAQIGLDKRERSGIVPGDYDNDGDLDLFITVSGDALYFPDPNEQTIDMLYRNEGNVVFVDVAEQAGVQSNKKHWAGFFFDYDNDRDLDLFVRAESSGDVYGFNTLYRNNGDGTFTEVTQQAGILPIDARGGGTDYGDYDNDGWLDLCVTYWSSRPGGQNLFPVLLYHNNRDGTFTDVSNKAGIVKHMDTGSVSFVDYDNDGDLDLFLTRSYTKSGGNVFYRNDGTENRWLSLKLVGRQSNRDAIGARVKVMTGELSMLREIAGGSHQWYHAELLPVHFGLGRNSKADVIEIRWPSGITQTFTDIPASQRLTIDEFEGILIVVRKIFPDLGYPKGDMPVQIQGEYFFPGSRVFFSGVEASDVRVESSMLITAITPPSSKGLVDVEVINHDGKRGILKNGFRYTTLQVTRITPESSPVTGGITVQIEGFGFQTGARVQIGNNSLGNAFVTTNSISGMLPPGTPGTVDVSVTNPDGDRDVLPRAFTYISPPIVERVKDIFVPLAGGKKIVIKGSGFIRTPTVQIGGIATQNVLFISSSEVNVRTPKILAVGPQDVVVINPDGQRDTLPGGVTVLAPPKIKSIEPTRGGLAGGTKIMIVGEPTVEVGGRSYPK